MFEKASFESLYQAIQMDEIISVISDRIFSGVECSNILLEIFQLLLQYVQWKSDKLEPSANKINRITDTSFNGLPFDQPDKFCLLTDNEIQFLEW